LADFLEGQELPLRPRLSRKRFPVEGTDLGGRTPGLDQISWLLYCGIDEVAQRLVWRVGRNRHHLGLGDQSCDGCQVGDLGFGSLDGEWGGEPRRCHGGDDVVFTGLAEQV
jgi:hypothetical protein